MTAIDTRGFGFIDCDALRHAQIVLGAAAYIDGGRGCDSQQDDEEERADGRKEVFHNVVLLIFPRTGRGVMLDPVRVHGSVNAGDWHELKFSGRLRMGLQIGAFAIHDVHVDATDARPHGG